MHVAVRKKLCSGCLACELVCVAEHEGVFGTAASRIRVEKKEWEGLDAPSVCRLCEEPGCVEACPTGALYKEKVRSSENGAGSTDGVIRLREELCDLCGECALGCRYGGLSFHPATGYPINCDLCGGDPQCVKRCVTGAIRIGGESNRKEAV